MIIYGIDFTSRPTRSKPLICLKCTYEDGHLQAASMEYLRSFEEFEAALQRPGPWVAGIDCPFGQSRRFIENIGWPQNWADYVALVGQMTREKFRATLEEYRKPRPMGDKEHRRAVDDLAKPAVSPQKLEGVPVGLMFYEGARRLQKSGVTIPLLQKGDPERVVVEAYPGVLVREWIGTRSYKADRKAKQTEDQFQARVDLLKKIKGKALQTKFGFKADAPNCLINDPGADDLDSPICAIQAAWAYTQKDQNYGIPTSADPLEGWISHPGLAKASQI